jgi:hypothetical protein
MVLQYDTDEMSDVYGFVETLHSSLTMLTDSLDGSSYANLSTGSDDTVG